MKRRNTLQKAKATIKLTDDGWRDKFRGSVCRVGFQLSLTRSMLEMLCAISDDVHWNRSIFPSLAVPDNWIATEAALLNRGLITEKSDDEFNADVAESHKHKTLYTWQRYKLSPAGERAVDLVRMSGLFVEADMAVVKKMRKA